MSSFWVSVLIFLVAFLCAHSLLHVGLLLSIVIGFVAVIVGKKIIESNSPQGE